MTTGMNALNPVGFYSSGDDYFGLTGATNTYNGVSSNIWNNSTQNLQYQYGYNNTYNAYNNKYASQQLTIQDQCTSIATVLSNGQEDEVLSEFNELVSTLRSQEQYAQCSDQELRAMAKNIFQNMTGISLTDAINQNCSSSFTTGLKNVLNPFGDDSVSKEDLLAEINGTKKKKGADASKVVGEVAGIAGCAAGGAGVGFLVAGPVGAAVGGVIGGAVGLIKAFI